MIKNYKKGMSLAEILIALAIVAVIATLGFSISKKGIEKAYDYYIYTTYAATLEAIADANSRIDTGDFNKFAERIRQTFSGKKEDSSSANSYDFSISNGGIKYTITPEYLVDVGEYYKFIIALPTTRKSNGTDSDRLKLTYIYRPNYPEDGLIPYNKVDENNDLNLNTRKDLLPFYLEDEPIKELTGSDGNKIRRRQYYSYQEAFCRTIDPKHSLQKSEIFKNIANIECDGFLLQKKLSEGPIKVTNPRKIF